MADLSMNSIPDADAAARKGAAVADMEEAVAAADAMAEPGDTVLLAPGCASFDMYSSYGERRDHFASLVLERKGA